jgi:hypothetical protein
LKKTSHSSEQRNSKKKGIRGVILESSTGSIGVRQRVLLCCQRTLSKRASRKLAMVFPLNCVSCSEPYSPGDGVTVATVLLPCSCSLYICRGDLLSGLLAFSALLGGLLTSALLIACYEPVLCMHAFCAFVAIVPDLTRIRSHYPQLSIYHIYHRITSQTAPASRRCRRWSK